MSIVNIITNCRSLVICQPTNWWRISYECYVFYIYLISYISHRHSLRKLLWHTKKCLRWSCYKIIIDKSSIQPNFLNSITISVPSFHSYWALPYICMTSDIIPWHKKIMLGSSVVKSNPKSPLANGSCRLPRQTSSHHSQHCQDARLFSSFFSALSLWAIII